MSQASEIAQEEIQMEMTPMIDVTFLLLIFFLLTLKFKVLEGKLEAYLPMDSGAASTLSSPIERLDVRISVLQPGRPAAPGADDPQLGASSGYVGRVLAYGLGPRHTRELSQLGTWLREAQLQDPEARSTIHSAADCVYGDVVPVLDALLEAGFERIGFAGEAPEHK